MKFRYPRTLGIPSSNSHSQRKLRIANFPVEIYIGRAENFNTSREDVITFKWNRVPIIVLIQRQNVIAPCTDVLSLPIGKDSLSIISPMRWKLCEQKRKIVLMHYELVNERLALHYIDIEIVILGVAPSQSEYTYSQF